MNNFIAFDKLSKKEKKKINSSKRKNWGDINPVSKRIENKKAYNRNSFKNFY